MQAFAQMTIVACAAAALAVGSAAAATPKGGAMTMAGYSMRSTAAATMHMTCRAVARTKDGMTLEFRNTGSAAIPAGAKAHWRLRGTAQGDATFKDALGPHAMMQETYMMQNMRPMSGHPSCSVSMM